MPVLHTTTHAAQPTTTATSPVNAAAQQTDAPDEKAVSVLLETAENEEQKRRANTRWCLTALGTTMAATCVALLLIFGDTLAHHTNKVSEPFLSLLQGLIFVEVLICLPTIVFFGGRVGSRAPLRQKAIAALSEIADQPRCLLPLIDGLWVKQTSEWRNTLFPVLTERLWNLSPQDAALWLDEPRRAALRNLLAKQYGFYVDGNYVKGVYVGGRRLVKPSDYFDDVTADLAVAAMKTLAQLGDAKTAKILRKIIKAKTARANTNDTVVQDAAREYLPILEQKQAENETLRKTLRERATEELRSPYYAIEEFTNTLPTDEAKVALVNYLRAEKVLHPAYAACAQIGFIVAIYLCVLAPVWILRIQKSSAGFMGVMSVVCGGFLGPIASKMFRSNATPESKKFAYELARRSETDTRLLPLLLTAAQSKLDAKQADAVKKALVRLLPLVRPGDAALIPPANRAYLRSWLKLPPVRKKKKGGGSGASQTLTIAALNALAAVGDIKTLPAAEKIVRRTMGGSYHETELHEAALRCVEVLRARRNQNGSGESEP